MMTRLLLALLACYRRWLSPALHALAPGACKFVPTCSEFAAVAIVIHGPFRGCILALCRLLRCHPFSRGGFDPVPLPFERQPPHRPNRAVPALAERRVPSPPAITIRKADCRER